MEQAISQPQVSGYKDLNLVVATDNTYVYRAIEDSIDARKVIIKYIPRQDNSENKERLAVLDYEHDILQRITGNANLPELIAFLKLDSGFALITLDNGGTALKELIKSGPLPLA